MSFSLSFYWTDYAKDERDQRERELRGPTDAHRRRVALRRMRTDSDECMCSRRLCFKCYHDHIMNLTQMRKSMILSYTYQELEQAVLFYTHNNALELFYIDLRRCNLDVDNITRQWDHLSPPEQQLWLERSTIEVDRTLGVQRMFEDEGLSDRQLKERWLTYSASRRMFYKNWVRSAPANATTQEIRRTMVPGLLPPDPANAASGMAVHDVHDDCNLKFMELKAKRTYRFIVYKIEEKQKQVIVEKLGEPAQGYEDFTACLPADECRYAVYDFEYLTEENDPENRIFFIGWSPDSARVTSKMIYASSKDKFKRELDGIQIELQATNPTEMGLDVFKSHAN